MTEKAPPITESDDRSLPELAPSKPVARQFASSALGEIVAFSLAIGAVYVSDRLFPKQIESVVARIARSLGQWRDTSPEMQTELAKKIFDVGIMNMAGISGMAVQFGMRRAHQKPEEKTPFWYEAGRLAVGRLAGTITAIGTLALMTTRTPGLMKGMESGISKQLGTNAHSDRLAELFVSNAVQTVGAIAGNAPAQLLYDRLVHAPANAPSRSGHNPQSR